MINIFKYNKLKTLHATTIKQFATYFCLHISSKTVIGHLGEMVRKKCWDLNIRPKVLEKTRCNNPYQNVYIN